MKLKKYKSKIIQSKNLKKVFNEVSKNGFCKINLFSRKDIDNLFKNKIINNLNKRKLLKIKLNKKNILKYHQIVKSEKVHKNIIDPSRRQIKLNDQIINKIKKNKFISNLVLNSWKQNDFDIRLYFKKKIKKNCAAYRLARPYKIFKNDVGGAHLDLHFNNKIYSNFNLLYTIWVPIIGFSKKYTLKVSPRSHKIIHNVKYFEKQKKYISKVFKKSYLQNFKFKRINMNKGDVIIFHPNLLHGSSKNLGNNTRMSIDLRIFNKSLI